MDMTSTLESIAQAVPATDAGYIKDGILHCRVCNVPKQCKVTFAGIEKIFPCLCDCEVKAQEEAEARVKEQTKRCEIKRARDAGIADARFREWTFDKDDGSDQAYMNMLKKYADNKYEMKKENMGLFIFGEKGTGKTFGAACLANRLIEEGEKVIMSTFPRIERMIFDSENKNHTISEVVNADFLIIDDFGVERKTEYQQEMIYTIIDERYKANKPLIITSNISYKDLLLSISGEQGRVYERIAEMCQPVNKSGKSRRMVKAISKSERFKELMK